VSLSNRFVWFRKWIVEKQTIAFLSRDSNYSSRTLKRYFHHYLEQPPKLSIYPSEKVNLIIDGTYFTNNLCLVLYRDNTIKFTQLYRLTNGEWFEELAEDLTNLLKLGVQIESITCDGHKALLKAIRLTCPQVIVQRCIIHIQRQCLIWLSKRPKSEAGKELRKLFCSLHTIHSTLSRDYWIVDLIKWHEKHREFINEKSVNPKTGRYWFTHKMVRRSFNSVKKALPDMFHYLDDPMIPSSTNGLESFFGHLKVNLNVHRGLSVKHTKQFIQWYLYFKNQSLGFLSHGTSRIK
jgi:hypothetical protein